MLSLAAELYAEGIKGRLPAQSVPNTPPEVESCRPAAGAGNTSLQDGRRLQAPGATDGARGLRSTGRNRTRLRSNAALLDSSGKIATRLAAKEIMSSDDGTTAGNSTTDGGNRQDASTGVRGAVESSATFNLAEWLQLVESAGILEAIPLLPTYGHADVGWTDDRVSVSSCSMVLKVRTQSVIPSPGHPV